MSVTVEEHGVSRSVEVSPIEIQEERRFTIRGTSDQVEARLALLNAAPASVPLIGDSGFRIIRQGHRVREIEYQIWEGIVYYSTLGQDAFEFELGIGFSEHLTINDRGPRFAYPAPGRQAPNTRGLIGIDGDQVRGVDIPPSSIASRFIRRKVFHVSQMTDTYVKTLSGMVHTVNNAPFWGFNSGEVLFLGVHGGRVKSDEWELFFHWAVEENATNIPIPNDAPVVTVPSKDGWDYLWVLSAPVADAHMLVRDIVAVYVERLFPRTNFANLGIGTVLDF